MPKLEDYIKKFDILLDSLEKDCESYLDVMISDLQIAIASLGDCKVKNILKLQKLVNDMSQEFFHERHRVIYRVIRKLFMLRYPDWSREFGEKLFSYLENLPSDIESVGFVNCDLYRLNIGDLEKLFKALPVSVVCLSFLNNSLDKLGANQLVQFAKIIPRKTLGLSFASNCLSEIECLGLSEFFAALPPSLFYLSLRDNFLGELGVQQCSQMMMVLPLSVVLLDMRDNDFIESEQHGLREVFEERLRKLFLQDKKYGLKYFASRVVFFNPAIYASTEMQSLGKTVEEGAFEKIKELVDEHHGIQLIFK